MPDEIPGEWRTASTATGPGNAVEWKRVGGGVALRDSSHAGGDVLVIPTSAWRDFVAGVRAGEFDVR